MKIARTSAGPPSLPISDLSRFRFLPPRQKRDPAGTMSRSRQMRSPLVSLPGSKFELDVHFVTRSSVLIDLDYSGSLWERGSFCTKITLGPRSAADVRHADAFLGRYSSVRSTACPTRGLNPGQFHTSGLGLSLPTTSLRAAAEDHPCNLQIAAEFRCDRRRRRGVAKPLLDRTDSAGLRDLSRGRVDRGDFPPRYGSM